MEEPMIEYIAQFRTTPFVVRLDGEEFFLTQHQFELMMADMQDAKQAFEAEKMAHMEYLKMQYERARKGKT